jgi:hypothetical protein
MSQVLFETESGVIADVIPDRLHPGNEIIDSANWSGPVNAPFKCIDVEHDAATVKQRIADAVGLNQPSVSGVTQIDVTAFPAPIQSQLTTGTRGLASTDQLVAAVSLADGLTLEDLNGNQ